MMNSLRRPNSDNGWENIHIKYRESSSSPVDDFHEHDYYEINFIISGNIKILLPDCVDEGTGSRIVLTAPNTPHFVSCRSDLLYRRFYLLFSRDFIDRCNPEWSALLDLFGQKGRVVAVTPKEQDFCRMLIGRLENEASLLRQKLLVLYLLSYINEFADHRVSIAIPSYIMQALSFIEEHYYEKLTAEDIAKKLHIGRTSLMTNFKKYTESTLNHYIVQCRLKKVVILLHQGKTESEIAERCGFGDVSGLIRSFKKYFGTTPGEYLRNAHKNAHL